MLKIVKKAIKKLPDRAVTTLTDVHYNVHVYCHRLKRYPKTSIVICGITNTTVDTTTSKLPSQLKTFMGTLNSHFTEKNLKEADPQLFASATILLLQDFVNCTSSKSPYSTVTVNQTKCD